MVRAKRTPSLGKEEQEGFDAFAREHYSEMMTQAFRTVKSIRGFAEAQGAQEELGMTLAIFDKLATPRVFLIERWHELEYNERMAYYPDRAELEKKAAEVSAQAQGMITK